MNQPKRSLYSIIILAVLAALAFGAVGSALAKTPAGTEIRNQAVATYEAEGQKREAVSNIVLVTVRQVAEFEVLPAASSNAQEFKVVRGQTVTSSFTVRNTGNGLDSFFIKPLLDTESDKAIHPVSGTYSLYIDVNGDGLVDAGDTLISTYPVSEDAEPMYWPVPAGGTLKLLARLRVPNEASEGESITIRIEAVSKELGQDAPQLSGIIRFNVVEDGVVTGTLQAEGDYDQDKTKVTDAGEITYTVNLLNHGFNTAGRITVNVAIPSGTDYVEGSFVVNGEPADDPDDGKHEIVQLHGGQRYQISWRVKVTGDQTGGTEIRNRVGFTVGSDPNQIYTNEVVTTVLRNVDVELKRARGDEQYVVDPVDAGKSYTFEYKVKNTGNAADIINIQATLSGAPWPVELYALSEGNEEIPLDKIGGYYTVGMLNRGTEVRVIVKVRVPATEQTNNTTYNLTVKAWSATDPMVRRSDTVSLKNVNGTDFELSVEEPSQSTDPGKVVEYRVTIENLGFAQDLFTLTASNVPEGYTVRFFDSAGNPTGDIRVPGTGSSTDENKRVVLVRVTVPADAKPDSHGITVTATSQNSGALKVKELNLTVNQVVSVTIAPSHVGSVNRGGYTIYTLTVANEGNTTETVTVRTELAGSGQIKLLYRFITENEGGTPTLGDTITIQNLAPGASVAIRVRVDAPTEIVVGTTELVSVIVMSGSIQLDRATLTTTVTGGELQLDKDVDKLQAKPGDELTYKVEATNLSVKALDDLVIYEKVPTHTTFVSASERNDATLYYSTDGGSSWDAWDPAISDETRKMVTDVKWVFDDPLAANASVSVTFKVRIN